jgi:chromate reductase, NAD(P)H dehydrogenase (quinone)
MPDATAGTPALKVLGICGSLRKESFNRRLLQAARELAPTSLSISIFERLGEVPPYNYDVESEGDPEPVTALKAAIGGADALLIATPEYNYGVPGVLKNALDWASRPAAKTVLKGKPVAILGASTGRGGTIRAQLHLRQVFIFTESYVMLKPEVLVARAAEMFDGQGQLTDEKTRELLAKHLAAIPAWVRRFRDGQAATG